MEILFLNRSKELAEQTLSHWRTLHNIAEIGMDLPKTQAYVMEQLRQMGVEPHAVGQSGVTCTVGHGAGKTILLRGDMDALPMSEESGLECAATNGHCHSCGHDSHTAMLLASVKLLKEQEDSLNGKVKFMFQPGEEVLSGALDMIDNGILDGVDVAFGQHIMAGDETTHAGTVDYCVGASSMSGTSITIEVNGLPAHGSTPELGIDAITIASHIVINLQETLAREISCFDNCVLLVGTIEGGTTSNTVPGTAKLGCSLRTASFENDAFLKQRVTEIATQTATLFRGTATVNVDFSTVPMITNEALTHEMVGYGAQLIGADKLRQITPQSGGEDFAYIAQKVPTAFFYLGAGSHQEGYTYGMHHPKMTFDLDVLPVGAAMYAHCAKTYLDNH